MTQKNRDKTIRVGEDTHEALFRRMKTPDDTYDDVIRKLLNATDGCQPHQTKAAMESAD